jgi:hypothetical protein
MPPLLRWRLGLGIAVEIVMRPVVMIGKKNLGRVRVEVIHKVIGDFSLDWVLVHADNIVRMNKRHLPLWVAEPHPCSRDIHDLALFAHALVR